MRTFTAADLSLALGVTILFLVMFRLQRALDRDYYFSLGELIYGIRASIAPLAFALRALLIFAFALVGFVVLRRTFPVYFGVGLGSFLIVWPGVVVPIAVEPLLYHRRKLVLFAYFMFVAFSLLLTRVAEFAYAALAPSLSLYAVTWRDPARLISFLGDKVVDSVGTVFVGFVLWWLVRFLKREIVLRSSEIEEDWVDDFERADATEGE
jgi:hypothetical protein